uniref:Protein FAR1-RELATED SEQUENCE n=1 Tax=Lactuca sativa TaxID=4236 RepID=A0A9R1X7N2_LACSA|nr:hypothetical protein LSAT_V11C600327250 [Lactuca sativa]
MYECRFDKFQENHKNELEDTFHLKSTRTLSYSDKKFIVRAFIEKMGATKAYKLKSTLKGNYRHFKRDMGSSIGFRDAQLILNKLKHTTTSSEMYVLVFVPFIVIDHHKSSVTIGFLKDYSNKQPLLVLTDQDAAIKQAIDSLFVEFLKNTDFKKMFNKLVWDIYIEHYIFERSWQLLMKEFNLEDERWFKDIFENKEAWIPAYFNDFPRCWLMKTTSRSESINSFFNNPKFYFSISLLITTRPLKNNDIHSVNLIIKLSEQIVLGEQHAPKVYTSKVFFGVQKEIYKGGWFCDVIDLGEGDGWEIFKVIHKNQKHEVELKYDEKEVSCTCGHFNRFCMLCRHAFRVLMDTIFNEIPYQYILRRWTKDVISLNYQLSRDRFYEEDEEVTKLVNELFFNVETTLDIVRNDKQKLACLVENTQLFLNEVKCNSSSEKPITNSDVLEKLYDVNIPKEVEIFVPYKRLIGEVEKSVMKAQTKSRNAHYVVKENQTTGVLVQPNLMLRIDGYELTSGMCLCNDNGVVQMILGLRNNYREFCKCLREFSVPRGSRPKTILGPGCFQSLEGLKDVLGFLDEDMKI